MTPREMADAIEVAMVARDRDAVLDLYAEDIVFYSPVTAVAFRGKSEMRDLMTHVLAGFETWERTFVVADDEQCVFGARGRIGGREVELTEHILLDSDGRVSEIRLCGRPMSSIAALAAAAAPPLAARRGAARGHLVGLLRGDSRAFWRVETDSSTALHDRARYSNGHRSAVSGRGFIGQGRPAHVVGSACWG